MVMNLAIRISSLAAGLIAVGGPRVVTTGDREAASAQVSRSLLM